MNRLRLLPFSTRRARGRLDESDASRWSEATQDPLYVEKYVCLWQYCWEHWVDHEHGGQLRQFDPPSFSANCGLRNLQVGCASKCPETTSVSMTRRRHFFCWKGPWRAISSEPQAIAGGKCDYHTLVSCSLAAMA